MGKHADRSKVYAREAARRARVEAARPVVVEIPAATVAVVGDEAMMLEAVRKVRMLAARRAKLERDMRELVQDAREAGASWSVVATAAGVDAEAARYRWGRPSRALG